MHRPGGYLTEFDLGALHQRFLVDPRTFGSASAQRCRSCAIVNERRLPRRSFFSQRAIAAQHIRVMAANALVLRRARRADRGGPTSFHWHLCAFRIPDQRNQALLKRRNWVAHPGTRRKSIAPEDRLAGMTTGGGDPREREP